MNARDEQDRNFVLAVAACLASFLLGLLVGVTVVESAKTKVDQAIDRTIEHFPKRGWQL
jgi:hypothetical protein